MTALNSEGLEKAWRFDIQYGPDGEANYAWVYKGKDLVATMRTHYADSIVEAMNRRALLSALPGEEEVVAWLGTNLDGESEPFLEQRQAEFWSNGACHAEPLVTLASLQAMQARAEAAEARVKVLEETLEPFATFTEKRDDNPDMPDSFPIVSYALDLRGDIIRLTLGDFRRSRTARKGGSNG